MPLGVSDLTYATLKDYALDKLQDNPGEKTARQVTRSVKRALKLVAESHDWPYLRRWHRFVLRESVSVPALGSCSEFGSAFKGDVGVFAAPFAAAFEAGDVAQVAGYGGQGWNFVFSGTGAAGVKPNATELHRVRHYSAGAAGDDIYFYSNDRYHHSADTLMGG